MLLEQLKSLTVIWFFCIALIALTEQSLHGIYLDQASYYALRAHYLGQNYQDPLRNYIKKTSAKSYDFHTTTMHENRSTYHLSIKTKLKTTPISNLFLKNHFIKTHYIENFYLGGM